MRQITILLLFSVMFSVLQMGELSDDDDDDDDDEDDDEGLEDTHEEKEETETEESDVADEEMHEAAENETVTEAPDEEWLNTAIRDIAYFLRAHKFNDFDRRYHSNEITAPRNFFKEFPDPPLRSLHWEVRKYCEPGFVDCIQYLHEKAIGAELHRKVDTVTIVRENNWHLPNNTQEAEQVEGECQRYRRLDWIGAQPFQGPLERFQWRTSASYYMCWYTMHEEASLTMFGEPCDNFANCLDPEFKESNGDPRANDRLPFQCATYSFCPDPCCPRKHYYSKEVCWQADSNPCYAEAPHRYRQCGFNRTKNRDFVSLVLNRWNVSCVCEQQGYEWDSRFGICIDVDECVKGTHSCRQDSESCFNVAGSYKCGCRWGYLFDSEVEKCILSKTLIAAETEVKRQDMSAESGKSES